MYGYRYQGMIKGYSGIFRLGEATSTWDADSPVRLSFRSCIDNSVKLSLAEVSRTNVQSLFFRVLEYE